MNSKLTYGRSGLAATWDGNSIYVVGGSDGKQYSDEVFKYIPENDTLITLPGKLPSGRTHIQAEIHNGSIYIFGGRGAPTILYDQILRYELETNKVNILEEKLPLPTEFRMHAYDGQNIYVIGGFNSTKSDFNQFIIFTPDAQSTDGTSVYCPPDNEYSYVGIALAIVAFVVIMTLVDRYRRKKGIQK
jgi:N-acetylneuraminic acid mutarotase